MFVSTEKRAWSINTLYKCTLRTGDVSIRFCCGISRLEFIVLGLEEQAITAQQLKNHRLAWRAKQWPLVGKTLFSSIPPSNSLISVGYPCRAFWAYIWHPPRALRLASYATSGTAENVRCVALGAEVPGHHKCTSFSAPKIGRARTLWRV